MIGLLAALDNAIALSTVIDMQGLPWFLEFTAERFIKFAVMAYLGSYSLGLLKRIWGIKDELKHVGVKID